MKTGTKSTDISADAPNQQHCYSYFTNKPPRWLHKQRYRQNNRRCYPQTDRVHLHNGCERWPLPEHGEYPREAYTADPDDRTGRRYEGNTKASQIARQNLLRKAEQIREENVFQPNPSCCDHLWIWIENAK